MVDFQKSLAFTQSPQEQAGARVMLSLAFLKTGDKPACIAQLQEACRLDPSNRQARTLLQQITGR
jgi:Tfp pilus assembly protein PilF